MNKKVNNFFYCLHAKCLIDELKILLKTYSIDFYNEEVLIKKFYFDEISYFIFESSLDRQEFSEKLNAAPALKDNVAEVIYLPIDWKKNQEKN